MSRLTVGLQWWENQSGKKVEYHEKQFKLAGFKTVKESPWKRCDCIYSSIPGWTPNSCNVPIVQHYMGYGEGYITPEGDVGLNVVNSLEEADMKIILDPNIALTLKKTDVDKEKYRDMKVIPLSRRPETLFCEDVTSDRFIVLNPSKDWDIKKPEKFIEAVEIVGREAPEILFIFPSATWHARNAEFFDNDLNNLIVTARLPHHLVKMFYKMADVVTPWSFAETFSFAAMESMFYGKPTITKMTAKTFTIAEEYLDSVISDFGMNVEDFHERWKSKYFTGDGKHFIHAETPEELAENILKLYTDRKERERLGDNAKKWESNFWTERERAELYSDLLTERYA